MNLRWTPTALRDLEALADYIRQDRPDTAAATVDTVLEAIEQVARHPESGREGRAAGTREVVVRPYVIACRIRRDDVELLAIIHGARRWPDSY